MSRLSLSGKQAAECWYPDLMHKSLRQQLVRPKLALPKPDQGRSDRASLQPVVALAKELPSDGWQAVGSQLSVLSRRVSPIL